MTQLNAAFSVSLLAAFAVGCSPDPGATLDLQIDRVNGAVEDVYGVDWDGGVTWTREIGCGVEEGSTTDYTVDAVDRSQGELTVAITLQAFDGPGEYQRDEFQPSPLLSVDWTDPDTEDRWHLGTDSGGVCIVAVKEGSAGGAVSCEDVGVFLNEEPTLDLAFVAAVWSCGTVDRGSPFSARRTRRERDPSP